MSYTVESADSGRLVLKLMHEQCVHMPQLRPLLLIVKVLLSQKGLNKVRPVAAQVLGLLCKSWQYPDG